MELVTPSQNEGYVVTPFHNTKTISKFKVNTQKLFFPPCFKSRLMFASTTSTCALCSTGILNTDCSGYMAYENETSKLHILILS